MGSKKALFPKWSVDFSQWPSFRCWGNECLLIQYLPHFFSSVWPSQYWVVVLMFVDFYLFYEQHDILYSQHIPTPHEYEKINMYLLCKKRVSIYWASQIQSLKLKWLNLSPKPIKPKNPTQTQRIYTNLMITNPKNPKSFKPEEF